MSIIQTIRERGAVIVIAIIALSLIGFILMDSRSGTGKLFGGGNTTTLGSVNGDKIELSDFNAKVKDMEQQYPNGSAQSDQIRQTTWDQIVAEKIVGEQFDNLGLNFTPKEMSSVMFGDDAPQQLKQAFTNKETGQYDIAQAEQWWAQTKKAKNEDQRKAISSQIIEPMTLSSLYSKYTAMIGASVYIPKWLAKLQDEQKNNFATISYVAVPYAVISDSTIKVTDDDIKNYVEKNKNKYKQEAGRMISYVSFNALASAKDSAAIKQSLEELKPKFAADTNASAFVARNSSAINFFDGYTQKSKLQMPDKDSIPSLTVGSVFGPYLDGKNFVLAKMVETKQVPDSVKVRHILIKIADSKKGQIRPDTTARKLIDSIALAIKNGADFNQMVLKYSDDDGSKNTKGEYDFSSSAQLVDSFYQTAFYFPVGTKRIVKGESQDYTGYHYIEVLKQTKFEPAYKVAYMAKEIVPSDETINDANAAATKLSGQARDKQAFDKYAAQNGLKEVNVPAVIKENDYQLGSLQDAREVVKWAFTAKEGEVSEPFSLKDAFVVATVDSKIDEGVPDVKTARPLVESALINIRKADEIKKNLNNPATLDAAAKPYNERVLSSGSDSTLTFDAQIINGIGNEPKVAGAAFNKEYQTKISPPIAGNTGVYLIKVTGVFPKAPSAPETVIQRKVAAENQMMQSALGQSFLSLKKMAKIKDYRSKFF